MAMDFAQLHYQNDGKAVWINLDMVVTIEEDPRVPGNTVIYTADGRRHYFCESVDEIIEFIHEREKYSGCRDQFNV